MLVVARLEQPAQRGRHGAAAAADAQRQAVALDLRHDLGVAAQPPGRLGRDQRAVLELGAAAAIGGERGGVDVDDDLRALGPLRLVGRGERCLGEIEQRLDPGRARRLDGSAAVVRVRLACRSFAAAARSSRRRSSTRSRAASNALISSVPSSAASRARRIQRAVVVEVVVDVLELVRLAGVLGCNPAEGAKRPLELRRRERPGELEQALLGGRRRDPASAPAPS